eukprot:m.199059 g.199059  ORF g.199059 m.199059 type:complete len:390 (-) comp21892_c0_seq5:88-1257(-)
MAPLLLILLALSVAGEDPFQQVLLKEAAASKGAVCLDGTPGAYYIHRGSGSGANKWILFLQGGGWCESEQDCYSRSSSALGSSASYGPTFTPSYEGGDGLLGTDPTTNPDFYNWNLVYAMYCDGASFAGDQAEPIIVNGKKIYFRGWRVLNAILTDLMSKGMASAERAILGGCSAGGLAAYQHCDYFASLLPNAHVRCIADAGYFPDFKTPRGVYHVREAYTTVYTMQNVSGGINQGCIQALPPTEQAKCFFPMYMINYLKTPIFALNSGYDSWQTKADWFWGVKDYNDCASDLTKCNASQLAVVQDYHQMFLATLQPILNSSTHGAYIDSCFAHCQSSKWSTGVTIANTTRQQAFSAWYSGTSVKLVDCPWPCTQPGSSCNGVQAPCP